jgi:hypothetical protein
MEKSRLPMTGLSSPSSCLGKHIEGPFFSEHVKGGDITVQEQSGPFEEIEQEAAPPLSLAIYFPTSRERDNMLFAAQIRNLMLNEFLAGAVRMVLAHQLILTEFACPDLHK